MKLVNRPVLLLSLGLVLLLFAAEAALRLSPGDPSNLEQTSNIYDLPYPATRDSLNPFADGVLAGRAWDARGRAFPLEKPADTLRIVFLGNSITYGFGLEAQSSFPFQVQEFLNEKMGKGRAEVINAGYPGTGFYQQLIFFRSVLLPASPDLVFVCSDSGMKPELIRFRQERQTQKMAGRLLEQSAIFRRFSRIFAQKTKEPYVELEGLRPELFPDALPGKYFMQDLNAFFHASVEHGFHPVFPIVPNRSLLEHLKAEGIRAGQDGYDEAMFRLSIYRESIVFAKKKDLPALDLVAPFLNEEPGPGLMIDDGHMGPRGNEILAQVIGNFILGQPNPLAK